MWARSHGQKNPRQR